MRKRAANRFGGRGEIRTLVRVAPKPDFESGAFNHSATLPLTRFTGNIAIFAIRSFDIAILFA